MPALHISLRSEIQAVFILALASLAVKSEMFCCEGAWATEEPDPLLKVLLPVHEE